MLKLVYTVALITISGSLVAQADSASVYLQKGLDEKSKGRRLVSLQHFEKAASYKKDDKKITAELAAAYLDLRRYGQAKTTFQQLEKLGDQSDSTYRQLMLLSFNM